MKITELHLHKCFIQLEQPLSISFHTFHQHENYFIELVSSSGIRGYGEGAPFGPITGDDITLVRKESEGLAQKLPDVDSPEEFYHALCAPLKSSSLRAALDCAFIDLVGKEKGLPGYNLFITPSPPSDPSPPPNSVTVFIRSSEQETARETERILTLYPHLKVLKIKLKGEGDIERIRAIKAVCTKPLRYILDANQGFKNSSRAVKELSQIVSLLGDVILIEEPCPRYQHEMAREVREGLHNVPIVADESCTTMDDLEKILAHRSFNGINIKLQKIGGITPGLALAKRALAEGLTVMVGQMFEGPLGSAAGLHLTLAAGGVTVTDLDMDLELPETSDVKLPFANGARGLTGAPGLGVAPDFTKLEQLSREGKIQFERWI